MDLNFLWSYRFVITVKTFLTVLIMYLQRNGFNIEIICMTCAGNETNQSSTKYNQTGDCYAWTAGEVAVMTGIFAGGYGASQAFSGVISHKLGATFSINCSIFISSVFTFLIPFATYGGYRLITCLRFLTGIGQGFLWAFIQTTVSSWSPDNERSFHLAVITCGLGLGPAIAFLLSGVFCGLKLKTNKYIFFRNGWALYFYMSGFIGFMDLIINFILMSDNPDKNRFVSKEEAKYINSTVRGASTFDGDKMYKLPIRWKLIFKSVPMWAFIIASPLCDIGLIAMWIVIPQFMHKVIKFDIEENGLYNSLPYIFHMISIIVTGVLSEHLRRSKKANHAKICKTFHGIGCIGSAFCLIAISFTGETTRAAAIVILIFGFIFHGITLGGGIILNCNDFAGQLSGVTYTVGNTVSAFVSSLVPFVTAQIIKDSTTAQWRTAFILYAVSYILSATVFMLFGSSDLQNWAKPFTGVDEQ